MSMNTEARADDFIGDNKRKIEKIDGRIYLMASASDEHKNVQDNINTIFNNYFERNKRRCRAINDAQVYLNDKNYLEPDVKILCRETRNDNIPVLVIEVLSKTTQDRDYGIKMKKYAELGIKEYWLVDWKDSTVAVYLLDDGGYEYYKTYALYIPEDKETRNLDEAEKAKIEITTEFSPVSFPDLVIKLDKVFDIFV